jgi:predicted ATPase
LAAIPAAVPLWLQLSLMEECRRHVERALANISSAPTYDARRDLQLSAALGSVLVYTNLGQSARDAWTHALEIAEQLNEPDYKLRALWGLWVDSLNNGAFQAALELARRFSTAAVESDDPTDVLMGERMVGITLHFLGDQAGAQKHINHMLDRYVAPIHASHIVRFQFDQRLTARAFRARCLWLLGLPDQALQLMERTVEDARATGHALSVCNVLGQGACPVAFWSGDLVAAQRYVQLLMDYAASHTLNLWRAWVSCFEGLLVVKRGDTAAGLNLLRSVLAEVVEIRSLPRYLGLLGELASAMGQAGETGQALDTINGAIERSERRQERWCLPELLRVKGELMLLQGSSHAVEAASGDVRQALDLAREQSALSWELRAASSLARLQRQQGNHDDARILLNGVYGRFTEGFGTSDLQSARRLLDELG